MQANWMSGAVQIPTESYDEMGLVGQDKRWEIFGKLHDYLHETFPKVYVSRSWRHSLCNIRRLTICYCRHETLTLTKINTFGLLYHWNGSDTSLKPLLLMGHQGETAHVRV